MPEETLRRRVPNTVEERIPLEEDGEDRIQEEFDNTCYWLGSYVFNFLETSVKECVQGNLHIFKYILGRYILDPDFSQEGNGQEGNGQEGNEEDVSQNTEQEGEQTIDLFLPPRSP